MKPRGWLMMLGLLAVMGLMASACGGSGSKCGDCDDGVMCTVDTCNAAEKTCEHNAVHELCPLGQVCDLTAGCVTPPPCTTDAECDDSNPCTDDACDQATGCTYTNNAIACDDGSECTGNDTCAAGVCAGTAVDCDDGNACTDDSCDPADGCQHAAVTGACDDGDACTTDDTCADGVCGGTGVTCDDANPCTDDSCDAADGCVFTDNTAACDDGNACTTNDTCADGACAGTADSCDDNNVCTTDSCSPTDGCQHADNTLDCDDSNACTTGDTCADGTCNGSAISCDDSNVCTDDSCDQATGCAHANNTAACDDGNNCTDGDTCADGTCVSGTNTCECQQDADCAGSEDGNLCNGTLHCVSNACVVDPGTIITCDATGDTACQHNTCNPDDGICSMQSVNEGGGCDDGDACTTTDVCTSGTCGGTARTCDDGNACTDDSCDPATGCVFTDNAAACDDGDACTENDTCSGGTCGGTAVDCDDSNVCTTDSCSPASGCQHANNANTCDDGNSCTTNDVCTAGACVGTAIDCDDNDPCTDDSCDQVSGCQYTLNTDTCDDGNACTENDTCSNGNCSGTVVDCDDSNVCTDDSCDPVSGCQHADNTDACDDGDACTANDTCVAGNCAGAEGCCGDMIDNDLDGTTDCADSDCAGDPVCTPCTGTLADVRAAAEGAIDPPICLDGVRVTYLRPLGANGNGYFIQKDQTGPAVFVFTDVVQPAVEVGNTLRVLVSSVYDYNGLWEVDDSTIVTNDGVAGSVADLVQDFSSGPAVDETAESELVRIDDAVVASGGGASWVVAYGGFAYQVQVYSALWPGLSPCLGMTVSLQAPVGEYFTTYQLTPFWPADFLATDATGCNMPVGWCRLQWPLSISGDAGTTTDVYGHLYVAGLTDQSAANDPWPSVMGQVGYGTDGSTPDGSWTWIDAVPNPGWDGDSGGEPNNDEYMATLTLPDQAGSPYDYAYRFSGDGGMTWTYCDINAGAGSDGSEDGYQPANAGDMQITGGSAVNLYFSEYLEGSSSNKAVEIYNAGADPVDLSTCQIVLYSNGSATPTSADALDGSLAADDVYVACNASSDPAILSVCDHTSSTVNFNGDDAFELTCGGVTMDVIGQIGVDPGTEWLGSGGVTSTLNDTLQRQCSVLQGDSDGSDAFDPDIEWLGVGQDNFTGLGARGCP